jgi:transcriptional regulator with XRE-family HTH domain
MKGLTLEDLAEKVGIRGSYVSRLENGKRKNPRSETVKRLTEVLGINPEDLYTMRMPANCLPELSEDVLDFLVDPDSLVWIRFARQAKASGVKLEALTQMLGVLETQRSRRRTPIKEAPGPLVPTSPGSVRAAGMKKMKRLEQQSVEESPGPAIADLEPDQWQPPNKPKAKERVQIRINMEGEED